MPKEITQIIDTERPDGWMETTVVVTDTETGEQKSGSVGYFCENDRGPRVEGLVNNLLG